MKCFSQIELETAASSFINMYICVSVDIDGCVKVKTKAWQMFALALSCLIGHTFWPDITSFLDLTGQEAWAQYLELSHDLDFWTLRM